MTPRTKNVDVYYNKIEDYIREKYETRLKRMFELKEDPVFVIDWYPGDDFNQKILEDFIGQNVDYKTKIFMPYKEYSGFRQGNIFVIYEPLSITTKTRELANKIKDIL